MMTINFYFDVNDVIAQDMEEDINFGGSGNEDYQLDILGSLSDSHLGRHLT